MPARQPKANKQNRPRQQQQGNSNVVRNAVLNNIPTPTQQRVTVVLADVTNKEGVAKTTYIAPYNLGWASTVASCHQEWRMRNPRVWFEPAVGTDARGTLHMTIIRDDNDLTPSTALQFINCFGSTRKSIGNSSVIRIPNTNWKAYISKANFDAMSKSDRSAHMAGRLDYMTEAIPTTGTYGIPDGTSVGKIYLEFTPEFRRPIDPALQG